MKKAAKLGMIFLLVILLFVFASPVAAGPGGNANGLNARFLKWQEKEHLIHILVFNDAGRDSAGPAVVPEGQSIIMGFEWTEDTIEDLENNIYNNPNHYVTLSIDGGPAFSVNSAYQAPFVAATRSGPKWSWDHDGDGPGDGDGDGIGDWVFPVIFFRYEYKNLTLGTHTFFFTFHMEDGTIINDTITVEVVAP